MAAISGVYNINKIRSNIKGDNMIGYVPAKGAKPFFIINQASAMPSPF